MDHSVWAELVTRSRRTLLSVSCAERLGNHPRHGGFLEHYAQASAVLLHAAADV